MKSDKIELLPCPFCDGEFPPTATQDSKGFIVICVWCSALGPTRRTREEAIEAWNTRIAAPVDEEAYPDITDDQFARLKASVSPPVGDAEVERCLKTIESMTRLEHLLLPRQINELARTAITALRARSSEDTQAPDVEMVAEDLARQFHETYERLAPEYSYQTRKASAVPWEDVPENNKRLMIATCAAILVVRNSRNALGDIS